MLLLQCAIFYYKILRGLCCSNLAHYSTCTLTLGLLTELDSQSRPLIIDTEYFVKHMDIIKFQAYVYQSGESTDRCRRSSGSNKTSAEI